MTTNEQSPKPVISPEQTDSMRESDRDLVARGADWTTVVDEDGGSRTVLMVPEELQDDLALTHENLLQREQDRRERLQAIRDELDTLQAEIESGAYDDLIGDNREWWVEKIAQERENPFAGAYGFRAALAWAAKAQELAGGKRMKRKTLDRAAEEAGLTYGDKKYTFGILIQGMEDGQQYDLYPKKRVKNALARIAQRAGEWYDPPKERV